jgi:hypothetical protein
MIFSLKRQLLNKVELEPQSWEDKPLLPKDPQHPEDLEPLVLAWVEWAPLSESN